MKLLLCLFGALFCAASAFPHIIGLQKEVPPQCGDPTFACQDLASARLCGVVKTCIHDIWSTMSVPNDNDEVCDICKEMVKEARDQLLSNMTQEEIKEVFEGSCKLLPIKLIADGCIKVVDEIIPELVEMLASRMDPTMVCTVSGMCFPTHSTNKNHIFQLLQIVLSKEKTSKCEQCTALVQDAQTFLETSSMDGVKTYLEKLCDNKTPSFTCRAIMNQYLPLLFRYVKNIPATEVCGLAGICTPTKCHFDNSEINDELTCEFCEHVLQHMKDLITANTTVEEFKTALLNFCNHTGSFSDKCTSIVNDYYDMLFDYIRKLDTKGMCTLMGICGNDACMKVKPMMKLIPAEIPRKRLPLIKLQPAHKVQANEFTPLIRLIPASAFSKKEMKESNDIFQPLIKVDKFVHPMTIFQKDTECALCKAFSFYLEKDLDGDKSKDSVRNAINRVCSKWMVEYPEYCNRIVERYSMKMQYAIAEEVAFEDLCSNVKACPLMEKKPEMLKIRIVHKDGPLCDLCKIAMNEIEDQLSDPATKQKLKDLADQGCSVLPKALRDDCVNFINQNVDAVIDILQQELKPDNICPALRLCAGTSRISVPPRIKDLECDVCKDVVTSFRQKLQDPASKEIVLIFLEEACARLPTSVATECKKFVDEEIDTFIKIIIAEMDPDSVCSLLNICQASLIKEIPKPDNDMECELCKEVVSKVEDMVKDKKTEDEIKTALDKVCSYLPSSISTKCENFVNLYTDILISLLTQELDPEEICAILKACPSGLSKTISKSPIKDVECELCKELVSKLEDMVKDKKTEAEIKEALDKVCSYLPSSVATKCENFVNQYTETLILLLTTELEPGTICSLLKVCPASLEKVTKSPVKDMECELCKEVITKVEDLIKDKETEAEIKEALDKVCTYLPSSIAAKCENFVNQYMETLIILLTQELDPGMVCSLLKVCPAEKEMKIKDVECDLCKEVIGKLEDMVKDKTTEDEIRTALDKVCSYLPSSLSTKCESFVDKYTELLISLLANEMDPAMICAALNLCPTIEHPTEIQLKSYTKAKDLECQGCQYALHFIQNQLMDSSTQNEVKNVLKKTCSFLPSEYMKNCEAFVDEYGSSLLVLIAQEIDPSIMCFKLQMCPNQSKLYKQEKIELNHFNLDDCSMCTTVVDYLDKMLEEDDVDKEITQVIERVCTVVPSSFKDKCITTLETYGPYLLQMIGQLADSKQVCQDIDLCPRSPTQVHLIGGSKCTFGPSYWCKSAAHASSCKAETYCKANNLL